MWCDLNKGCTVSKLHDLFHNPKCIRQKQITFTPKQYMLETSGFENTMRKIFKGSQNAWNNFLKPAVNLAAPFIEMAVSAKTKNFKVGQATTNILKNISGGKILKLTYLHCNGLHLKVK